MDKEEKIDKPERKREPKLTIEQISNELKISGRIRGVIVSKFNNLSKTKYEWVKEFKKIGLNF